MLMVVKRAPSARDDPGARATLEATGRAAFSARVGDGPAATTCISSLTNSTNDHAKSSLSALPAIGSNRTVLRSPVGLALTELRNRGVADVFFVGCDRLKAYRTP